ncbi:polysaccharide export protein [Sphingomonas sp. CFBP 13728]|uniref:polysaccharide biosynthesis/export family protein n=1 Tax=Sphingomonas sp. CFBP 13728 TaxID=2775294 RepID=UPI001787297A|nr:polysaccharide biosynthesis/export family protein [Sphingomonas sp. CFBP 13728]MBD8620622.1 polysaccharide export protein [Sphingomonas sp. CFBP 13728]
MRKLVPLLLPACLVATGCAHQPKLGGAAGLNIVESSELPAPDRTDNAARPYYVGPFDKLSIDVFGIDALSGKEVQVDASGRMSFPLVGTLEIAGKTPGEVGILIEQQLRGKFIRNPQVTVNLKETVSQVITIEGEVREPGLYPVIGRMTLLRAVATAKGTTEFTKLDDIVVFRTSGGRKYAALYNLRAIRNGAYADPEVFANDVVMVGESRGRRLFRDLVSVAPLLTTPLIVALQ